MCIKSVCMQLRLFCVPWPFKQKNKRVLIPIALLLIFRYKDVPKFGLGFSGDLTHADNNPGQFIDADLAKTLRYLKDNGHLDNTLLIVMGDHGARYSGVRW